MQNKQYGVSKTGIYSSSIWRKAREATLKRDGNLCQCCLHYGIITPATIVHHITPLTTENYKNGYIAFNLDNLISVCDDCHNRIHNRTQHSRYKLDEEGEIISCNDAVEDDYFWKLLK